MTDVPFEDREDERELEPDLLADPNAAGDPEPEDVRGGSDDPQHWAGEGRAPDSLRNAESAAMHIEEDAQDRTRADEGDVEIL